MSQPATRPLATVLGGVMTESAKPRRRGAVAATTYPPKHPANRTTKA